MPEVVAIPGQTRQALRILIADDSQLIRKSMIAILRSRPAWEVCGESPDGADAVQKAINLRPDVVLLDISMPGKNGLEAARMIRQELPKVKILVVSLNDAVFTLPSALAAGADGLIIEVHPDPDNAVSDGKQSLDFLSFAAMMETMRM